MMPGNNQTSDNAANGAAEDMQAGNGSPGTGDTTADQAETMGPQGDPFEDGSTDGEGPTGNDPLEFGDQRMGEDATELSELEQLQKQVQESEAKAADNWDRLLRLQADMENQRKRAQNDVTKARKFALEGIVNDLLPVKDSLEMGLAAAQTAEGDNQSIIEGAELTLKMLAQVFEKNNIIEINPVNEKFDPEFHQAMSMQEVDGVDANTVASVMQKGYTLNDRLVRPALVMVAK